MNDTFMENGLPSSGVYSLKWNNFQSHLSKGFNKLLEDDDFTDVTLACSGNCLRSHKIILSLCSPFFKRIFKANRTENSNTVVIINNVRFEDLHNIISFVYNGQVNIKHTDLSSFLMAAELLQIEGLAGSYNETLESQSLSDIGQHKNIITPNVSLLKPMEGVFPGSSSNSSVPFSTHQESHHSVDHSSKSTKRPKLMHNAGLQQQATSATIQSVLNTQPYRQSFSASPTTSSDQLEVEHEIVTIEKPDTSEVEIIDPLKDEVVILANEDHMNMTEKDSSIGIYPEDKAEDEEPIFLESMPSGIRIEGTFSSEASANSLQVPSTSSSMHQRQAAKYSVPSRAPRNPLETKKGLPLCAKPIDIPTSFRAASSVNQSKSSKEQSQSTECSYCGKRFKNTNVLRNHKSIYHREETRKMALKYRQSRIQQQNSTVIKDYNTMGQ